MKTIALNHGKVALVDDADYERLSRYKWCARKGGNTFYAVRSVRMPDGTKPLIYMHRQILGLTPDDPRQCDHKNHNGLDNRRENLHAVMPQQNQWNRFGRGYDLTKDGRYVARIGLDGGLIYLGQYDTPAQAHRAYLEAKVKYHHMETALLDPIGATYDD